MVIERSGGKIGLDLGTNHRGVDEIAAIGIAVIERQDQQSVAPRLEERLAQQRAKDIGLKPGVSIGRRCVVGIMTVIRND